MAEHAILSPSASERWLNCTPSARLELQFPDSESDAAKEGTLAHRLGELLLRHQTKLITKQKFKLQLAEIQKDDLYDESMLEYSNAYADFVLESFSHAQARTKDALLFIEEKLDLTEYIPEGYGTGDSAIVADVILRVNDLKYGKGVIVSAVDNRQMMLYSLGWLEKFSHLYDIQVVEMAIFQPRIDNISVWEMSVKDLYKWAKESLIPLANLAFKGVGEFVVGDHCKFCRASGMCKAYADHNLEMAKHDFAVPALMADEDVSDVLSRMKMFIDWIGGVKEYALNEAINNNKKWPGFKLVTGKSNRVYTDEDKIAKVLIKDGHEEEEIFKPKKLRGITEIEALVGKNHFSDLLKDYVDKPKGKPTLVPESDKRPALDSEEAAKQDFQNA
jgi:hypothetical protein